MLKPPVPFYKIQVKDPVQTEDRAPLGDTSLMSGIEVREKCGTYMEPKVFFGMIYGWRCPACNPSASKQWSKSCNSQDT